jgi:hypothetical protein
MNHNHFAYFIYELEPVLENILKLVKNSGEPLMEGSCFYQHQTQDTRIAHLFTKQYNLYSASKEAKNILEIGFNAGHSCLIFLNSNPYSQITVFDICEHKYTKPCFEYLSSLFPGRLTLIEGDSTITVPSWKEKNPSAKFDLIHIDGAHDPVIADKDFNNCYTIATDKIIWDDTQEPVLRSLLDSYIEKKLVEEVKIEETYVYKHAIVKVLP